MPRNRPRAPNAWRCKNSRLHFTYKGHLTIDQQAEFKSKIPHEIRQWSFVHESADDNDPYEHTHIFIRTAKPIETENVRYFDVDGIHPNIQFVASKDYERAILRYHQKEGTAYLEQVPPFRDSEKLIRIAAECDPLDWINDQLEQGGNMGQIAGMLKYQQLAKKRKREEIHPVHTYTEFTKPLIQDFKCMYVWGPTDLGKTQWVKMHFTKPLIVRHMDQLKDLTDEHDGIIFDDMNFQHLPRESNIHITDWEDDSAVHCRNTCGFIPRYTRKIFTGNHCWEETFHNDPAVRRRFDHIIHITERTYQDPTDT